MLVSFDSQSLPSKGTIILVAKDKVKLDKIASKLDKDIDGAITKAAKLQNYSGKKGEILVLAAPAKTSYDNIIIAGLGSPKDIKDDSFLKLGGKISVVLNNLKVKKAFLVLEGLKDDSNASILIAEGASLRGYRFDKYKTKDKEKLKVYLQELSILCEEHKKAAQLYKNKEKLLQGVFFTRNLITEPSNILYPKSYAEIIKKELTPLGVKVTILDTKQMQEEKMGSLLGVAQGSHNPPQLVIMEWAGDKKSKAVKKAPIGFVGKGVTFDTGGISIKPAANMWDMKYDMGGSAVVVGLMKSLAGRKAKVNVVGVVALVENMPGGNAQRPGDVVTSMSGQTIEVLNTDAEGRLILADALTYIQKYYNPELIVDLATLTGAIVISLGFEHAGLFSNNDKLSEKLTKAGIAVDEKLWRMPMGNSYDKLMDSPIADMQNINLDRGAGSITAAQFLKRFIENDLPWAHLDIAGVTWADKDKDICPRGATGFGVRLLDKFVSDNYES